MGMVAGERDQQMGYPEESGNGKGGVGEKTGQRVVGGSG